VRACHGDKAVFMGSRAAIEQRHPLLNETVGHAEALLGNQAIVRGALEAGVGFVSGYPGTPSSEVTDTFARLSKITGIAFEYAVNEKIAVETAFGASLAGVRALCAMKHLGLMYAGDPLSTMPYVGTVGGLVIVSAGDPSCRTSPNEQDQRYLGPMLHVPMLDPATPQEALELTRFAFELSEESRLPVILRPTTRVCHTRGLVRFGALTERRAAGFQRDPRRFNPIPVNARRMRMEIFDRLEKARALIAKEGLVRRSGKGERGILAAGVPAATCADLLREGGLEDEVTLITLSVVHPLPEAELLQALEGVRQLLVIEELSPFLEDAVAALSARERLGLEILGKRSGHAQYAFELEPPAIRKALHAAFGLGALAAEPAAPPALPIRPPILCPGCPHRSSFFAARAALDDDQIFINDIGCYTLGYGAPLETSDALLSMGAGFTIAAGIARTTGKRTVGFMGDSTFFHSGMPALLDAIKDDVPLVAVILDNQVTAMTGFQESPTVEIEHSVPVRGTSIEEVVRALGAPHVERVDPADLSAAIGAFRRAHDVDGVAVLVFERACPQYLSRALGGPQEAPLYRIDQSLCRVCGRAEDGMRCRQSATVPFSRAMARSRSLELVENQLPLPATAPCAEKCPLHLCVQGYAAHIASGHYVEALELILERLPLPDSVCRVCDRPCEDVCVRAGTDGTVGINSLKRFVMDWAASDGAPPYDPEREDAHGLRVVIVGAGPAGLAAAHELVLRGYDVTLHDAAPEAGGLLRYGIPRYRLPLEPLERDVNRILGLGVRFVGNSRLGTDVRLGGLLEDGADAVFVAVGAARSIPLALESEEEGAPEVVAALDFLRQVADGESVPLARRVVVLGGGNAAVDAARTALRLGAEQVAIACLESRREMPAITEEILHAEVEGIRVVPRTAARRLVDGAVECVSVELDGEVFAVDRVRPVPGTEQALAADLVIVAIGQAVDRSMLGDEDPQLEWAADGRLLCDPETLATSHPRVFAGGDLGAGAGSVTGAIAAGLRAAWGIDRELRGAAAAKRGVPPPTVPDAAPAGRPGARRAQSESPRTTPHLAPEACKIGFAEVIGTFNEADARAEAERCMNCGTCGNCRACIDTFGCPAFVWQDGRIEIDEERCTGCGVCAQFCPNGAIQPVLEEAAP